MQLEDTDSRTAQEICPDCGIAPQVVEMPGLHPGSTDLVYFCGCGPHAFESGFYATWRDAEAMEQQRDSDGFLKSQATSGDR